MRIGEAIITRLIDGADLLLDFATLGEYGLEPVADAGCEGPGHTTGWEALAPARRRGACSTQTKVASGSIG